MEERIETAKSAELERFLNDLKAVVRDGQDLLQASMNGIKAKTQDCARTAEQRVREHPLESMGVVFGIGVLVGVLAVGLLSSRD